MKKRLFAVLLCVCLLVGLVPPAVLAVGTDTGKAIQLGTGGISGWDSADGYDYIYFGYWEIETDYTTPAPSNGGCWTTRPTLRNGLVHAV
ncbi:MAG: hypothetical protein ACLR23_24010 [Clostridia bacterium]